MCSNQPGHSIVVPNQLVLQTNDLSQQDIYLKIQGDEEVRMAKDIIYRLLFARDTTDLRQHIEGLVGTSDCEGGLLLQTYGESLSRRGREAIRTVANLPHHPAFSGRVERQRLVYHYIMFISMLTEQPFSEYIQNRCADRDALRDFIGKGLSGAVDRLLSGNMAVQQVKSSKVDLVHFVAEMRAVYCQHCTPSLPPSNNLP